ncbi:MAG TPA: calcium-binding protein, partial [Azospirillaceae bacterium]|nr:calcium-binding protein [Azospirillaceae bacterium]
GGAGDDVIAGNSATGNVDTLSGGAGNDTLTGGAGNDVVSGGDGADTLDGAAGHDTLSGGADGDTLAGGSGNDVLNGDDGADTLDGGSGDDTLSGGNDGDTIVGGLGNDALNGDDGSDTLSGNDGSDTLSGGNDGDTLLGGSGNDTLNGDAGNDTLNGGDDADTLNGGIGDDTLTGGNGDDVLTGGTGVDQLTGGAGADIFVVEAPPSGTQYDTVTDAAAGDQVELVDRGTETFNATMLTGFATFQNYLDAAAAGDGSVNGAISWFQFGGDTYVVQDLSNTAGFVDGTDIVVRLAGAVDLGTATLTGPSGNRLALPYGLIYGLTTGGDTINGAGGDDTINGLFAGNATDTLTAGDSINGGGGTDTLNLTITGPLNTVRTNAVTVTSVETVNLNAAGGVAFAADLTSWTGVQTVNVTNTATSTVSIGNAAYTGGAGSDVVTVSNALTRAIDLGGGNDTINLQAGVGAGASLAGGAGTADTLIVSAADAATLSAGGRASGFERIAIGTVGGPISIDLAGLGNVNYLSVAGVTAGGLTVTNLVSGGTVDLTAAVTAASSIGVAGAAGGATDVLNLRFAATNGFDSSGGIITVADVETINIVADDTDATAVTSPFKVRLNAAAATKIVLSGDAGVDLTGSTLTGVTLVDGSALTGAGIGGGLTVLAGSLATTGVTLRGGAGNDGFSSNSAAGMVDTLIGGDGSDYMTAGAGNDILDGGTGWDFLFGGAGDDTFIGGAGTDQMTGGTGNDTFVISVPAGSWEYDIINDATTGDRIQVIDRGTETFNATKLTGYASLNDYLNAAAAGNGSVNSTISWFVWTESGTTYTYVVQDLSASSTFQSFNGDLVVRLAGTVDLSAATLGGASGNQLVL